MAKVTDPSVRCAQITRRRHRRTARARTCHTRAVHHFNHVFKGRVTHADSGRWCTTDERLAKGAAEGMIVASILNTLTSRPDIKR